MLLITSRGLPYALQVLKRFGDSVRVTILDRLATPFGLVRSGVAPDHSDTKNVINQFTNSAQDPRYAVLGAKPGFDCLQAAVNDSAFEKSADTS